jgi:hypothetical protein
MFKVNKANVNAKLKKGTALGEENKRTWSMIVLNTPNET